MNWLQAVLLVYGLLNVVLGVMGLQKGSVVSLAAGGAAGIIVIASAFLSKTQPKVAYAIAAAVCIALLGKFLPGLFKEFKVVPGLVAVVSSTIVLACSAYGVFGMKAETPPAQTPTDLPGGAL